MRIGSSKYKVIPMFELFKIPNWNSYYIDIQGTVYRKMSYGFKLMKSHKDKDGYLFVMLTRGYGKSISQKVHRLVLEAFVGKCPEGMECCHNDGIRDNDDLDNLRWDTRSNNHKDKRKHGTGVQLLNELQVRIIRKHKRIPRGYRKFLANIFNVNDSVIKDVLYGRTWV